MSKALNKTFLVIDSGSREHAVEVKERFLKKLEIELERFVPDEYLNEEFYIMADVRIAKDGDNE